MDFEDFIKNTLKVIDPNFTTWTKHDLSVIWNYKEKEIQELKERLDIQVTNNLILKKWKDEIKKEYQELREKLEKADRIMHFYLVMVNNENHRDMPKFYGMVESYLKELEGEE